MAVSVNAGLISGLKNVRNVARSIGNYANISFNSNVPSLICTRKYSAEINAIMRIGDDLKPKKKLSKAMTAYLERAKEYDEFMKKELLEYEIGKRHLANMMGENPETFTQADVNKSIKYLFPSGLYEKKARPIMESPTRIFPPKKAAQFDVTGRPHHPFFYTCKPNYYQLLHDIVKNINELNKVEDQSLQKGMLPDEKQKIDLLGSEWMKKDSLRKFLLEDITTEQYEKFLVAVEKLADHPYSVQVEDFISKFRYQTIAQATNMKLPELQHTPEGRPYINSGETKRKTAIAKATVYGNGTGNITINGEDIRYFARSQAREQVSSSLKNYFSYVI